MCLEQFSNLFFYPMKAILFIILQISFAKHVVLKIGKYLTAIHR